jgi:sigma-B regulation protein RsbU (phosphoserine phosphatase)
LIQLGQSDQFVTVLLGILECDHAKFDFARAGHELPMLLDAGGTVRTFPHTTGQAIGIFEEILLDENTISLPPGGTLLVFTDGLTDCREPHGQSFGYARVQSILAGLAGRSGQQVCDALRQALTEFQSGASQDDDITLVAVHSSAA